MCFFVIRDLIQKTHQTAWFGPAGWFGPSSVYSVHPQFIISFVICQLYTNRAAKWVTIIYELKMIKYMNSIHLLHFFNFPQNLEIKRHNGININPLVIICINFFSIPQSRFETLNYTITCKLHNHHSSLTSMKNGDCVIYT